MNNELYWKYTGAGTGLSRTTTTFELNSFLPGKMLGAIHWNTLQAFVAEIEERGPQF